MDDSWILSAQSEITDAVTELRDEAVLSYGHLAGRPRTLYGYVSQAFSYIDVVSAYRFGSSKRNQTPRMRRLLTDYFDCDDRAAAVAVQMWRHTLFHTANPRALTDKSTGAQYRWLLHWSQNELPAEQQLTVIDPLGQESILNMALLPLLDALLSAVPRVFTDVRVSAIKVERAHRARQQFLNQQFEIK